MSIFGFESLSPGCGCPDFAVEGKVLSYWRQTGKGWHCPHCGEGRYFPKGKSALQKEQELRKAAEMREQQAQLRAIHAEGKAAESEKKYHRMRGRIQAGKCLYCEEYFKSLAEHMKAHHPDFDRPAQLVFLRGHFGLTQANLRDETGVSIAYISSFENHKHIPEWADEVLAEWMRDAQIS